MQPEEFNNGTSQICLLNKALYGLKQAARQFYIYLSDMLKSLGYLAIQADESVFYNTKTSIVIAVHINDLLKFGKNMDQINLLKAEINKKVEISDRGGIKYYLGIEISRNRAKKELSLS